MREIWSRLRGTPRNTGIPTDGTVPVPPSGNLQEQIEQVLREQNDSRTNTYGQVLFGLPEGRLSSATRILEVGMNERFFNFRRLLRPDVSLFGITVDQEHAEAARKAGEAYGFRTDVRIHNVDRGLPKGFGEMDLVLDIYSATHYAQQDPVPKYVQALRPGGVLAIVRGGGLMGMLSDAVRKNSELDKGGVFDGGDVGFRYDKGDITTYRNKKELIEMLRSEFPGLRVDASEREVIATINQMAAVLGLDTFTGWDLDRIRMINELKRLGLTEIKIVPTGDGPAQIGTKPVSAR